MAAKIPISSGDETPQYKRVQQLAPELRVAVQHDLCGVSELLLKHGMITEESHEEFTDSRVAVSHVRASSLIRTVLSRIKIDSSKFETFVKVLEEKESYYEAVLDKLRVDLDVTEQPTSTATKYPFSDSVPSDNESSALLRPRPQTQLHTEAQPRSVPRHRTRAREIGNCCVLICWIIALLFVVSVPVFMLLYGGEYLKCYRITFLFLYISLITCGAIMYVLLRSMKVSFIKKTALIVVMFILLGLLSQFCFSYFCGIYMYIE